MVNLGAATFGSSIGLLNSTAYPSSQGTAIWLSNYVPSAGGNTVCVAKQILDTFVIPISTDSLLQAPCILPGYDINNMDAIQALKLALASEMKNVLLA